MPVITVSKDPDTLTLVVVADFAAPLRRVWDAYLDPRQVERFWGPPQYPATFFRHDAFPGGRSAYAMTGPEGDQHHGYWEWLDVKAPDGAVASFEVLDGFALPDGTPNAELPTMRMVFAFEGTDDGTRMTTTTYFASAEALATVVEMGMEEGMRAAMTQIDDVVADLASFAAGRSTEAEILSDTQVRVSRVVRGTIEQVWRAHHEPELLRRWMLGPDGWSMTVCEPAVQVGDTYRWEWEHDDGAQPGFGFTGVLLESDPPRRSVTTEAMIGMDGPSTTNELTLTPAESGTLVSLVITYPDVTLRDTVLGTGMVGGMETSYARLESILA